MKTSVENINGKFYTVIRKPFDAEWVREQLAMGIPVRAERHDGMQADDILISEYIDGEYRSVDASGNMSVGFVSHARSYTAIKVILPALPRHPEPKHAPLLYRYMAEGLFPYAIENNDPYVHSSYEGIIIGHDKNDDVDGWVYEDAKAGYIQHITHALHNGERVKIAISEGEG